MPAYLFHTLSSIDFEDLARDLIQKRDHVLLQAFAPGPDQGVDLLDASQGPSGLIVQCKHYWKSGLSALMRELRREAEKVTKLKPRRYVLATSVQLTLQNKSDIVALFAPYCKATDDVLGCEDLNGLLRDHPEVERAHHKLWFSSAEILDAILRNGKDVLGASEKSAIRRKLSLYVPIASFDRANQLLGNRHCCILSGIPGIGKTTVAQMLALYWMNQGYEIVVLQKDAGDAFDLWSVDGTQLFYYDDFLGQSRISDRLGKNEDKALVRLIRDVEGSGTKRLLMTTREYLLREALQEFEHLNDDQIRLAKCVVDLPDFGRRQRARLVANHLWQSGLPAEYCAALVSDERRRDIVDHPNFSPRIVEWMTMGMGTRNVEAADYATAFLDALDHPDRLWRHAFEGHISADARLLLLLLASAREGPIHSDALFDTWAGLCDAASGGRVVVEKQRRFFRALESVDGTFVRSRRTTSGFFVNFHNPSIREYLTSCLTREVGLLQAIAESSSAFEFVAGSIELYEDGGRRGTGSCGGLVAISAAVVEAAVAAIERPAVTASIFENDGPDALAIGGAPRSGDRAARLAAWVRHSPSPACVQSCMNLCRRWLVPGSDAENWVGAWDLVTLVAELSPSDFEPIGAELLGRIVEGTIAQASDDDWLQLHAILTAQTHLVGEDTWAKARDGVEVFVYDQLEDYREEIAQETDREDELVRLGSLADLWEVDSSEVDSLLGENGDMKRWKAARPQPIPKPEEPAAMDDEATDAEVDRILRRLVSEAGQLTSSAGADVDGEESQGAETR